MYVVRVRVCLSMSACYVRCTRMCYSSVCVCVACVCVYAEPARECALCVLCGYVLRVLCDEFVVI